MNTFITNRYISKSYTRSKNTISLRSQRFQSSYCTKVRTGAKKKKKMEGGGGEEETLACKPHDSGKRPLIFHYLVT